MPSILCAVPGEHLISSGECIQVEGGGILVETGGLGGGVLDSCCCWMVAAGGGSPPSCTDLSVSLQCVLFVDFEPLDALERAIK